ncbi:unnamed protein product [Rotaria magnacalcarata]|uniref:Uncharacterized protein n=1 Tax=Rotaria magnacalcarata TaxID=392030 RepID=A0A820D6U8_9BILA|nr:unnamed protein product [Rotaria magnacalcarata]CAF4219959.1 unnamed protein product [Rotaria magnacalcarata]
MTHAINCIDCSGNEVTSHLINFLEKRDNEGSSDQQFTDTVNVTNYKSSQDKMYDITNEEQFCCGEILFKPLGSNNKSITQMVVGSINCCDIELRSIMQISFYWMVLQ